MFGVSLSLPAAWHHLVQCTAGQLHANFPVTLWILKGDEKNSLTSIFTSTEAENTPLYQLNICSDDCCRRIFLVFHLVLYHLSKALKSLVSSDVLSCKKIPFFQSNYRNLRCDSIRSWAVWNVTWNHLIWMVFLPPDRVCSLAAILEEQSAKPEACLENCFLERLVCQIRVHWGQTLSFKGRFILLQYNHNQSAGAGFSFTNISTGSHQHFH